jgi:CHASE3 domain sensor protein
LSSRNCRSSRSIALGIVLKIYLIIQIGLSFLKPLLIIILVEFREDIAILGGLVGILATFTGIMWMLVQQINKRIDSVEKRIDELREDIKDLREEVKEINRRVDGLKEDVSRKFSELKEEIREFKSYMALEVPHKRRLHRVSVIKLPHKQGE